MNLHIRLPFLLAHPAINLILILQPGNNLRATIKNSLVAGSMGLQFYAAAPLKSLNAYNLGILCIIDKSTRKLSGKETSMLLQLSRILMDKLELKLQSSLLIKDMQKNIAKE